jgi:N-acyl-D-amino-acid deacylase
MPLEEAIAKTSSLGARRFGLRSRGTIAAGNFADIVVFDAKTINSHADYRNPDRKPEAIFHVMVNGCFGVRDGKLTGTRSGRVLPRVH